MHIHIVTSGQTFDYVNYVIANTLKMAAYPDDIKFSIYCLDKEAYQLAKKTNYCTIEAYYNGPWDLRGGAHGFALNVALMNFSQNEINVVSDSDLVILMRGWDAIIVSMLSEYDVIGVANQNMTTIHNLCRYPLSPSPIWFATLANLDLSGLDLSQNTTRMSMHIENEEQAKIWKIPVGKQLYRDTGWKLPEFLYKKGYKSLAFDFIPVYGKEAKVFKGLDGQLQFGEHHIDGQPFIGHMQRCVKNPFRKTAISNLFFDTCERYLKQMEDLK